MKKNLFGRRSNKKRSKEDDDSKKQQNSSASSIDQPAPKTPTSKFKIRKQSRKHNNDKQQSGGATASLSDAEEPTQALYPTSHAYSYDKIRSAEVKRRHYNNTPSYEGRESVSSNDDGTSKSVSSLGSTATYNSSTIQRTRSGNTADYFTIFTNTNNTNSTYAGGNLAQPNSWTMSMDRRSRSRHDVTPEKGDPNRLDGHRYMRASGTSPVRSRESLGSSDQEKDKDSASRKNYGFIAAFKVICRCKK